jgi:hypothetical protein
MGLFRYKDKSFFRFWLNEKNTIQSIKKLRKTPYALFAEIISISSTFGSDRKRKTMYEFINDKGIFEIACFYYVKAGLYVDENHQAHTQILYDLSFLFKEFMSDMMEIPKEEMSAIVYNRFELYEESIIKGEIHQVIIDHLIECVDRVNKTNKIEIISSFENHLGMFLDVFTDAEIRSTFIALDILCSEILKSRIDYFISHYQINDFKN